MVRTVVDGALDVDHRVTGEEALGHGVLNALVDSRNQAAGDGAALDLVHELVAHVGVGLEAQPAVAELAGTAGLLLVTALGLGLVADGLAIRDAHRDELGLDVGGFLHADEQRVDLLVAHGGEDGLMGFLVATDLDGRIGLGGAGQEGAELVLFLLVGSLDGNRVQRRGQRHRCELELAVGGIGVARACVVELRNDDDVASLGRFDLVGLLAHHDEDLANAILVARASVDEVLTGLEDAGEHLDVAQAADERVGRGLEHEARGGTGLVDGDLFAVRQDVSGMLARMREERCDVLHEALDALLDDGGAGVDRDEDALVDGVMDALLEFFLRQLFALEVLHHDFLVGLGNGVDQTLAGAVGTLLELCRNLFDALGRAVLVEVAGLHANDVDDALEVCLLAERQRNRREALAEAGMQKSHGGAEVGVVAVDVVDVDGARDVHLLGFLPQLGRHDLRAIDGVNHEHGHLGGVHRGDRVADEVGVTGGVEQVDLGIGAMDVLMVNLRRISSSS